MTLDTTAPVITITSPADGNTVTADTITVTGTVDDNTAAVTINGVNATVANNTFTASGITLAQGANTITITATDSVGNIRTASITITRLISGGIPPDPATVAPPIDRTATTTLTNATEFLYTGSNPIQTGVTSGTIKPKFAAVLRGQVFDSNGAALSGVKIAILNHPEFGSTLTRLDGMFDIAVNGGDWLTVNYEKNGYLPVQRKIDTPWQDYAWLPEVVMIPVDSKVTTVDLNSTIPIQTAQSNTVTDSDGTRKSTLLFSQGTTASMKLPDGTWQSLSNISVRATEYTVGENGPKMMPAELPPTSGYTYAAEYTVDEALAAGAKIVTFSKPIISYIENFLNFPIGGIVPVGYYDREHGVWIPADNGKIIKILGITNGMADLDIDGSGAPATSTALTAMGITDTERQTLATLYQTGQGLWRVPITHFTPWDSNWPYGPPQDATPPSQPPPKSDIPIDKPTCSGGSMIECQNQVLGETVTITGIPFTLHYQSDRVIGRKAAYTLEIPVSGASIPASLKNILLEVYIAGNRFTQTLPAAPNQKYTIEWDGKDAYGRTLQGSQPVTIRIGYEYNLVYQEPANFARSFAAISGIPMTVSRGSLPMTLWQEQNTTIGPWDTRGQGLGGWTMNIHHSYDPAGQVLYLGSGERRSSKDINNKITTIAGNGTAGYSGDRLPATSALLKYPSRVVVDAQGNLFFSDTGNYRIRKIGMDRTISTIAGNGFQGYSGDDGKAINVKISWSHGLTIDGHGNLFIADMDNHRIRKVSSDGIITTIAGNGTGGYSGDGGGATNANLNYPNGIAIDKLGNLFIADSSNHRIRKVTPDGIITTIAGNGTAGYSGDGGLANSARLNYPNEVIIDGLGNLFIADTSNHRIRKVSPDGIITTVAGNGSAGYGGDGGLAINASLNYPRGITIDSYDNLFIADTSNHRIRKVSPDGIITTIAGNGTAGYGGDGGQATSAKINSPYGVFVDGQGNLFITDRSNHRIRKVSL
ncbi:MAG: hypothetical protein AABZ11_05040, partial [Nitrospinota bacterium]